MNQPQQNAGYRQEPMVNMSTGSPPGGNEQQWKHFLTNISPPVSRKLTFIGTFYIIIGLLNISLEIFLFTRAGGSYFGGFANGLLLFILGVLTLVLCQQQVYTLTSLYVLVVFQLYVLIIVFGFYAYILYLIFEDGSRCSYTSIYFSCNNLTTIRAVLIVDLIHFFLTFSIVTANLTIINNARRLPTISVTPNYVAYTPQAQAMPVTFHNPQAMTVTSTV